MAEKPAHLEPSKLGTKEYWDALYSTEIANHAHDPSDTGTAWFDDSDAAERLIDFLEDALEKNNDDENNNFGLLDKGDGDGEEDGSIKGEGREKGKGTTFLDLGTGNGSLLFGLRDAGWRGFMLGVDYSPLSVEFARRIERSKRKERQGEEVEEGEGEGEGEGEVDVHFAEHDVLRTPALALLDLGTKYCCGSDGSSSSSSSSSSFGGFDVVLDKGTFDAISLSAETIDDDDPSSSLNTTTTTTITDTNSNNDNNGDNNTSPNTRKRRINETYGSRVLPLVREGGLFIVTSCNWTEAELRSWFEDASLSSQEIPLAIPESQTTTTSPPLSETQPQSDAYRPYYGFRVVGRVEYPSFSFGGVKGQTISTLCFRKVMMKKKKK